MEKASKVEDEDCKGNTPLCSLMSFNLQILLTICLSVLFVFFSRHFLLAVFCIYFIDGDKVKSTIFQFCFLCLPFIGEYILEAMLQIGALIL